jgi:hypothetical protein
MNIREKYNLKESAHSLSLQPTKPLQKLSQWFLAGILLAAIILPLFKQFLSEVLFYSIYILLGYCILHSLYDIFIRARICYIFDAANNTILRVSPLTLRKKIMKLEEAIIFVSSEMGSWHYSLGAKKSHFIKSYAISENFSSGKKSEEKQAQYEDQILIRITRLIETAQIIKP